MEDFINNQQRLVFLLILWQSQNLKSILPDGIMKKLVIFVFWLIILMSK